MMGKPGIWDLRVIRAMRIFNLGSKNVKVQFLSYVFMSKNPSTNLCCRLQRLTVSYEGEISVHFNLQLPYTEPVAMGTN